MFELQDEITERIVGVIEPSVLKSEIERSRRKHPENLAAYDLYLRALPHLHLPILDGAKTAAPLLEEALRLDPNFPAAHAWLSRCHEISFMAGGFDTADRDAGIAHAEAVIASNTDDATALSVAGFNLWQLGQDYDRAVATIERALSHNPCCIWALTSGALVYSMGGEAARARTFADRSLRLSPFDPIAWGVHYVRSFAALIEGRPDEAVSHAVAAVHLHPHFAGLHAVHATALALAGRTEEGRAVARKAVEAFPSYNQGWIGHMVRDPALGRRCRGAGSSRGCRNSRTPTAARIEGKSACGLGGLFSGQLHDGRPLWWGCERKPGPSRPINREGSHELEPGGRSGRSARGFD